MSNPPLAFRRRPRTIADYFGQQHLLGQGRPLANMLKSGRITSMVLFGPPGVGKTALAEMIANMVQARWEALSAVSAGVNDVRAAVEKAREEPEATTILFLDEIHRFNKAQQDILLPHIESGLLTLIGATTENPHFALNNALLSRMVTFRLTPLDQQAISAIIEAAVQADSYLAGLSITLADGVKEAIYQLSGGDARVALNMLEGLVMMKDPERDIIVTRDDVIELVPEKRHLIDNQGDYFYDQLSAFHKSVRGTDPDAALFWLVNMVESGCDPAVLLRRMQCIASEDIGNADPRALSVALDAWQSYERLGMPEGILPLAQAATYLAAAPKSNAAYRAYQYARTHIRELSHIEVPMHLRQVTPPGTKKKQRYQYPHDFEGGYVAQHYRDPAYARRYYYPVARGLEETIRKKLARLYDDLHSPG